MDYQPPSLTITTYYKREVISGSCSETSNPITLNVLPLIANNTISASQTVCYNTPPSPLTGSSPTGGSGSYIYYWEQSTDNGITWSGAAGTNNASTGSYSPPALTVKTQYRRNVMSGLANCCSNVSNVITVDLYTLPTGTITNLADTTICGGSQVLLKVKLTGAAGYKVTYFDGFANGQADIPVSGNIGVLSVIPSSALSLNNFTYSLVKVEDANGCRATSFTGLKKAIVYKVPTANAGSDQSVCGPTVTLSATPSVGSGIWSYPSAVVASTINNPVVTVTVDSLFSGGNIQHRFYWQETNWQCKNKDSVDVTFFKRVTSIYAGKDTTFHFPAVSFHLDASPPVNIWEIGFLERCARCYCRHEQ